MISQCGGNIFQGAVFEAIVKKKGIDMVDLTNNQAEALKTEATKETLALACIENADTWKMPQISILWA